MCGVPQGSVQVHRVHIILFSFFGIVQSFTDIAYHVYADDSCMCLLGLINSTTIEPGFAI